MTKDLQELISVITSKALTGEEKVEQIQAILRENPELINTKNKYGETPLYIASRKGHLEIVKALLATEGIDANLAKNDGETPLLVASERGHLEIVKALLVIKGIDVNHANKHGWTPLFVAIRRDHPKIVQELLKHSVDINAVDKDGWTALYIASRYGHTEAAQLFIRHILAHDHKADKPDYLSGELSEYWDNQVKKEIFLHNNKGIFNQMSKHSDYVINIDSSLDDLKSDAETFLNKIKEKSGIEIDFNGMIEYRVDQKYPVVSLKATALGNVPFEYYEELTSVEGAQNPAAP